MESDEPRSDAAAQLAALRADRVAPAERVVQPWWYDVLLGLLLFGAGLGVGIALLSRRWTRRWVAELRSTP